MRRPRPQLAGAAAADGTPTQLSFPSAHATTSFAGALVYARLGLPAGAAVRAGRELALSRLYLGVHYPSDVLAGAALGTLVRGRDGSLPADAPGVRRHAGSAAPEADAA